MVGKIQKSKLQIKSQYYSCHCKAPREARRRSNLLRLLSTVFSLALLLFLTTLFLLTGSLSGGVCPSLEIEKAQAATATKIVAGYLHSLALKSDGSLYAWGYNKYGHFRADTVLINKSSPVLVGVTTPAYEISVSTDGGATWDMNYSGKTYDVRQTPNLIFKLKGKEFDDGDRQKDSGMPWSPYNVEININDKRAWSSLSLTHCN